MPGHVNPHFKCALITSKDYTHNAYFLPACQHGMEDPPNTRRAEYAGMLTADQSQSTRCMQGSLWACPHLDIEATGEGCRAEHGHVHNRPFRQQEMDAESSTWKRRHRGILRDLMMSSITELVAVAVRAITGNPAQMSACNSTSSILILTLAMLVMLMVC